MHGSHADAMLILLSRFARRDAAIRRCIIFAITPRHCQLLRQRCCHAATPLISLTPLRRFRCRHAATAIFQRFHFIIIAAAFRRQLPLFAILSSIFATPFRRWLSLPADFAAIFFADAAAAATPAAALLSAGLAAAPAATPLLTLMPPPLFADTPCFHY